MLGLEVEKDVILVGERDEEVSVATRLVCSVWQGMGWIATPVASVDKQNAVAMASLRAASTSRVIKILGRQRIGVPYSIARIMLRRLWSLRLTTFPPPELDHIRYVCMVDDRRTRQVLGYGPKKTLEETVLAVDEGRW